MNSGRSSFSISAGRESGPTSFLHSIPRITAVMPSMVSLSPSDDAHGRCAKWLLMVGSSLDDFVVRRVQKPHPPFKNAHVVSQWRAILFSDNLLACRLSTVQPHRSLQVLVETPLVVVVEKSLRFSKVLFEVGIQRCVNRSSSQIRAHRPQRLPRGLSFLHPPDTKYRPPDILCAHYNRRI